MRATETFLASQESSLTLPNASSDTALTTALNSVIDIYRDHWWRAHDLVNRFWISVATPLVFSLGGRMSEQLSAAYQTPWPSQPIDVDVVVYGNWVGAYTSFGPAHTMMPSTDPNYQGFAALEMLYHEASHLLVSPQQPGIGRLLRETAEAQGAKEPSNLWHALIFYTCIEYAKRDLADMGVRYSSPNDHAGLWDEDGAWTRLHDALDLFWKNYLNGEGTLDDAISDLLRALASPGH